MTGRYRKAPDQEHSLIQRILDLEERIRSLEAGSANVPDLIPFDVGLGASFTTYPVSGTGSFVSAYVAGGYKQNDQISFKFGINVAAATTAQVQLVDVANGSTVISGPHSIAGSVNQFYTVTGPLGGTFRSQVRVDLQVRRSVGAGAITIFGAWAAGSEAATGITQP